MNLGMQDDGKSAKRPTDTLNGKGAECSHTGLGGVVGDYATLYLLIS